MKLDAVIAALGDDARADAARLIAEAQREAQTEIARARADAAREVEQARAEGEAAAETQLASERARARRSAHERVLEARRAAWTELGRRAAEAALRLRTEPVHVALVQQLTELAKRQLGSEASVRVDPEGNGGVEARAGERRVDYTLPTIVNRELAALGPEVEELWT